MAALTTKVPVALWQEHFDFLLPRKEWLRVDEVATALGCDERTVLRHFEAGHLHGININAAAGQRAQIRYRRDSVILFLASRANFSPQDLRPRIIEILAKQPDHELALYQGAIAELMRKRKS